MSAPENPAGCRQARTAKRLPVMAPAAVAITAARTPAAEDPAAVGEARRAWRCRTAAPPGAPGWIVAS
ncbi:hypothetical protein [Sinosporangium siamense]|uniref:hypothetical protein n=1 Tax=Sinosporangium siamense TaxID=1367973 RepID=UPI00194DDC46|nr:hypothetical protein [Sinosporangium siamense]